MGAMTSVNAVASATNAVPKAPVGTGPRGRKLWADVLGVYELDHHELVLLVEMVRTADMLDTLHAIVTKEGAMTRTLAGEPRAHPALVEARQLRIAFARLAASLRLPAGDEGEPKALRRPQRRSHARGVYSLKMNRGAS